MEKGRNTSLRLSSQPKLIPKDISDSLGKLPPQATDLELAVLGALMLYKGALSKVPYLKPDHFYLDQHKEIFRAIKQVAADGAVPDFRLVIAKLREVGKIELVGGHYYVMEITTKVSGDDNIDRHARIVVEMSMKRDLISIASVIHHDAYEDTTDIFDLLKKTQEDLKFLEERETTSSGPEKIKALWEKYGISTKPERPESLIKIGDADVCTVGNISLLVGKKKSRKSLLTVYLLWIYLSNRNNQADEVVIFDTEQEEFDVWATRDRLFRMTNQYVPIFCLRGLNPKERRDFIEQTVLHWPTKLRIAVIDGIRDCMSNINDPDETTEVMSWLMRLNVESKIHFCNILHLNKTDGNARGHIGSELLNKAEVTIEVTYDDQTTHSIVKCESSRRKPFDNFAFTHSATGLPEVVGVPMKEAMAQDDQIKRLEAVFEGHSLGNKELRQRICDQFSVGDNKARKLLADYIRRGWILKSGPDRSPNTTYKLLAHQPGNNYNPPPTIEKHQTDIEWAVNRVEADMHVEDPELPFL